MTIFWQKWWGYLHVNGEIKVKRYYDSASIEDALESPFVVQVFEPFPAMSGEMAVELIKEKLSKSA